MNTDIRLKLSFRNHPKTKKLALKLGPAAPLNFIYLLMFAAESKPDGRLTGMDNDDVAIAAGYDGDSDEFVDVLLAIRYLELDDDDVLCIHDWEDNNPWAAGAENRKEHARKAAEARWQKEKGLDIARTGKQGLNAKNHAPGMDEQCDEQDYALQGAEMGNAPTPTPTPTPTPFPNRSASARARDLSDWKPPEYVLIRARQACAGITEAFIEQQRLDFITYAEGEITKRRFVMDDLPTKFQGQLIRNWRKHQNDQSSRTRESGTGSRNGLPRRDEDLPGWAEKNGHGPPRVGETFLQYRTRLERELEKSQREDTGAFGEIFSTLQKQMNVTNG